MKSFDFTCDARVTKTIHATSREEADKKWDKFCDDLNMSDHMSTQGAEQFYIVLQDLEPEVEEVDDK